MGIRTDMAIEKAEQLPDRVLPEGAQQQVEEKEGVTVTTLTISSESASHILGKPMGKYVTAQVKNFKSPTEDFNADVEAIAEIIRSFIPSEGTVLVAGLGNADITPDAIGPQAVTFTLATRHLANGLAQEIGLGDLRSVAAITPGVLGQTGIETAEIIRSVCDRISPVCVIVVDALACADIDRLGNNIQICDTGISPGSGVQNSRAEISQTTLGIPVIAIGVPTVVDMTTIAYNLLGEGYGSEKVSDKGRTLMVTPREIDVMIKRASSLVAFSINKALHPEFTIEDIQGLVGN